MIFQITDFIFPSHTSSPTYFKMFRYSRFFFFSTSGLWSSGHRSPMLFLELEARTLWSHDFHRDQSSPSGFNIFQAVVFFRPSHVPSSWCCYHMRFQHQSLLPSSDIWGTLQSPVITSLSALISLSFLSHHLDHMTNAKTTAILIKGFWVMPYSLSVFCEFPWNGRCSLGASKVPKLPNCPKCKNSSENNRLFKHNQ